MKDVWERVNEAPASYLVLLAYITIAILRSDPDSHYAAMLDQGVLQPAQVADGRPWLLLTYAFLHGGLLHVGFNSWFLCYIGPPLERSLGTLRYCALYVVAALGGGMAVCLWNDPRQFVLGGSGALFGMMGSAVALNMRAGKHVLSFLDWHGSRQLLGLIAVNLLIGLLMPMISNTGHIGGLVAGFVFTFWFLDRARTGGRPWIERITMAAVFLSLLSWCIVPVTRWDWLFDHASSAPGERRQQYLRAVTLTAPPDVLQQWLLTAPESGSDGNGHPRGH
jgi:membrane associated rhomboid family serine protease